MRQKRVETVKSVLLAVLLVMLVLFCILYMLSYRGVSATEFKKEQMDRLGGESVKYQYVKYMDTAYTFPEFMGLSDGRTPMGFAGDGASAKALYADVFRFYEKLFGSEGRMAKLSAEEGEMLFSEAIRGEYLYISYFSDLPRSVILGMADGNAAIAADSDEFIRELLILPSAELFEGMTSDASGEQVRASIHSFYALARDSAGNYYRYTTKYIPEVPADIGFHTNFYDAYTAMGGARPYRFAAELNDAFFANVNRAGLVTDTTAVLEAPLLGEVLEIKHRIPDEGEEKAILRAFFMNPEKISSYTDESGIRAYFDEGESVRFMPNGEIRYAALGQSGISLDEIFGYHPDGSEYDTFDSVGAALLLADSLGIRSRGALTVFLSRMAYDGEILTLSFGYRYGGIPLLADGSEEIFRVEIQGAVLRNATLRLFDIERTEMTAQMVDMPFALRGYLVYADERHRLIPMYSFSQDTERVGISIVAVRHTDEEGKP